MIHLFIWAKGSPYWFLDEMCTHMIDFEDRKLIQFKSEKGRVLTDFVAKYPEKKVRGLIILLLLLLTTCSASAALQYQ